MSTTTGSEKPTAQARPGSHHPGPPLSAAAVAFVVFLAAAIFGGRLFGTGSMPSPYSPPAEILAYIASAGDRLLVGGLLLFVSGAFLIIFAALAHSRLQFLAPNAPGPALCGSGFSTAGLLLASTGLLQTLLGQPSVGGDPALVLAVQYLQFALGGPGHTALLGIGVVGLAVTNVFIGRIPRWVCVLGIVFGVVAMLSCVALALPALSPAIPIGRFTSIIWLVVVAFLIPRDRAARRRDA